MNYLNKLKDLKKLIFKKQNLFFIIIVIIIFSIDRISKIKVISEFHERVYSINNFLNIDLIWNIGIGFGLLSTETNLFYNLVTVLIGIVVLILF